MRQLVTVLLTIALSSTAHAQLSNQFTSAALKALRTINRMTESSTQDSPGNIVAPRYVTEAVSAAGDVARTRSELKVLRLLETFLEDKNSNNTNRHILVLGAQTAWMHDFKSGPDDDERFHQGLKDIADLALDSPLAQTMTDRENACVTALSTNIRSGTAVKPRQCVNVVLEDIDFDKAEADFEKWRANLGKH
jgi:hypothetical protein